MTVPNASAIKTLPTLGILQFLSKRWVLSPIPITDPIVSNISTNKNENVIVRNVKKFCAAHEKLN